MFKITLCGAALVASLIACTHHESAYQPQPRATYNSVAGPECNSIPASGYDQCVDIMADMVARGVVTAP